MNKIFTEVILNKRKALVIKIIKQAIPSDSSELP